MADQLVLQTIAGVATHTLDDSGNATHTGTVTAAAFAGPSTGAHTGAVTVPDGSALMLSGAGTGTGDIVHVIGSSSEGMHLKVFEAVISPAAVETAVVTVPANSVVMSVQANVLTTLTGGGTTVTFSLGTTADPDKYGAAAIDALVANTKLNFIPAYAFLGPAEAIVLTGTAATGAADGNTALTVGTVRVRVVYWTLNTLDDV